VKSNILYIGDLLRAQIDTLQKTIFTQTGSVINGRYAW